MALQEFERRLERLVEGVFAKAFRSRLAPLEIGRRMRREMDVRRTVGVRGVIAPNSFRLSVSAPDRANFASIEQHTLLELGGYAREHARAEGYVLTGPVQVEFETDESLGRGEFRVVAEMVEGPGGGPTGTLVTPDGKRIQIGEEPITVGRHAECDVVFADPEVSRQHAEIRRQEGGFIVVDLDSLNGTRVNGRGVKEAALHDGDELTFGTSKDHTLRFETM